MARKRKKWQRGKLSRSDEPVWEPLLELAPEDIDDFMWMGEVELTDGARVQMYKHYWTRRYIHLDLGGRALAYLEGGRYEEVDAEWLLPLVFAWRESRASIVRRNEWIESEEITFARSATRHGVSRVQSLYVIRKAGICVELETPAGYEQRLGFFGDDADGSELELIAVDLDEGGLLVIHAMPLRDRFGGHYVEAMPWRA